MKRRACTKGVTFVEMIVVIGIVMLAMTVLTVFFLRIWDQNRFTLELGYATMIASRGVDQTVKDLRRATRGGNGDFAVAKAAADEVIFYANVDDDDVPERVRYFVDSATQTFNVGITQLDFSTLPPHYPSDTAEVVKTIADYVVNNPTGDVAFTYYDVTNTQLVQPVTPSKVTRVHILLFVNVDAIRQPNNVRIESDVVLRNLSTFGQTPT